MTLPSSTRNSDDMYPSNTASSFRVRLPRTIYLKNKYEVALAEILYPHTWSTFNNKDDYVYAYANPEGVSHIITIEKGYYVDMNMVTEQLNIAYKQADPQGDNVYFVYHEVTGKMTLHLKPGCVIQLSLALCDILGFEDRTYKAELGPKSTVFNAPYIADVRRGFNSLYVYCSLCEPQIVGDAYVPLLRTVFLSGKQGDIMNHIYDSPHYVPVNTNSFDHVEINIKNDLNENVSFRTGKVICKLHLRQKAL